MGMFYCVDQKMELSGSLTWIDCAINKANAKLPIRAETEHSGDRKVEYLLWKVEGGIPELGFAPIL